jgi:short-subunit dehydrogenase
VSVRTGDLSTADGTQAFLESFPEGPLDGLVNNAGAGTSGPWEKLAAEEVERLLQLLVRTPLTLTRAFLPGWKTRNRGAVLNIASSGAFQPGPQTAVYYAAKSFLTSWSLALAQEERAWLRVTTACPGALKTPFSENAGRQTSPGALDPKRVAQVIVKAWSRGRGLVIPGAANKLLVSLSRHLPPQWVAAAVDRIQSSLKKR